MADELWAPGSCLIFIELEFFEIVRIVKDIIDSVKDYLHVGFRDRNLWSEVQTLNSSLMKNNPFPIPVSQVIGCFCDKLSFVLFKV